MTQRSKSVWLAEIRANKCQHASLRETRELRSVLIDIERNTLDYANIDYVQNATFQDELQFVPKIPFTTGRPLPSYGSR